MTEPYGFTMEPHLPRRASAETCVHRDHQRGWRRLDWIAVLGGAAAVLVAALFNPVEFLARTGFPARELSNPWL